MFIFINYCGWVAAWIPANISQRQCLPQSNQLYTSLCILPISHQTEWFCGFRTLEGCTLAFRIPCVDKRSACRSFEHIEGFVKKIFEAHSVTCGWSASSWLVGRRLCFFVGLLKWVLVIEVVIECPILLHHCHWTGKLLHVFQLDGHPKEHFHTVASQPPWKKNRILYSCINFNETF